MEASMIAVLKTREKNQKSQPDTLPLSPDVYIVSISAETRNRCFKLLNELRLSGISVDMDYECRTPKAQMKVANKINSRFTIIMGPDEIEKGVIKLKNMQTGDETFSDDAGEVVSIIKKKK
jgi:histidyl-tRNA synthetase